jgi:hypothetical protein
VIPRAEMLAELMTLKPYAVAIAGTHGKTSTTSMVATVLVHAGSRSDHGRRRCSRYSRLERKARSIRMVRDRSRRE